VASFLKRVSVVLVALLALASASLAHDIPNQRVDRSIQVTLTPGRLAVDYEVSLAELTLTQELRALAGSLPGGDRSQWFERYAEVTGPLDARGLIVSVDKRPLELVVRGHQLIVEEHPRYTFRFEARLPDAGTLLVRDTNYASSEGTSRLAIRARDGVNLTGDELPGDVEQIPIRPLWELTDLEERRTRIATARFETIAAAVSSSPSLSAPAEMPSADSNAVKSANEPRRRDRISDLLDTRRGVPLAFLILGAAGLGAVHALQPGHGKTLITAVSLGPDARLYRSLLLAVSATLAHLASVLLIAAVLWITGGAAVAGIHRGLSQVAGFVIAAAGLWRVGRCLGGYDVHAAHAPASSELDQSEAGIPGIVSLGAAAGIVPCWDAVGLLVLAASVGRLGIGVLLVMAFSAGMAVVLATVAAVVCKIKAVVGISGDMLAWQRWLNLLSGLMLAAIGLFLFQV
jgi:ABC-type nickel/cobalt efflux system permease component RcnA